MRRLFSLISAAALLVASLPALAIEIAITCAAVGAGLQLCREGTEAWANGVASNRTGLERFAGYMARQGLVSHKQELAEYIAEETLAT